MIFNHQISWHYERPISSYISNLRIQLTWLAFGFTAVVVFPAAPYFTSETTAGLVTIADVCVIGLVWVVEVGAAVLEVVAAAFQRARTPWLEAFFLSAAARNTWAAVADCVRSVFGLLLCLIL